MTENLNESTLTKGFKEEALKMAVTCVRNTVIESYHEGKIPQSKTGDYSDVKVVTPYGEIAWNEVAKINDMEMKTFNKEVTNRLYTYLEILLGQKYKDEKEGFFEYCNREFPHNWDEPKLDKRMIKNKKLRIE